MTKPCRAINIVLTTVYATFRVIGFGNTYICRLKYFHDGEDHNKPRFQYERGFQ